MFDGYKQVRSALMEGKPLFREIFEVEFDSTPADLVALEKVINREYPVGHKPMGSTLIMLGFYYGEVIITNIVGAEWVNPVGSEQEGNPFVWGVRIPMKDNKSYVVFPIQRMANFWHDRTDVLYGQFNMLNDLNTGALDPSKQDYYKGNNYVFRSRKADPDSLTGDDKLRLDVVRDDHDSDKEE